MSSFPDIEDLAGADVMQHLKELNATALHADLLGWYDA